MTQIRNGVPSLDGSKLAFTALNRLYVMDLPDGTPERLTKNDFTEAQPTWSPDGESIVFASWETDGGHLYKVNANGRGRVEKLTEEAAIYNNPAWSYNGNRIVFTKGSAQVYRDAIGPRASGAQEDLAWISADGGKVTVIDKAEGRSNPHFTKVDNRIYLSKGKSLLSIRWDGTDQKSI